MFLGVLGAAGLEGEAEEVDAEEDQDQEVDRADEDDGAAGAAEVGVGGLDAAELDPPADGHDGDGVLEEDESDDADEAEEREEDGQAEGEERAEHDAEVTGVAAGRLIRVVAAAAVAAASRSMGVAQKAHCCMEVLMVSLQVGHEKTSSVEARLKLCAIWGYLIGLGKGSMGG